MCDLFDRRLEWQKTMPTVLHKLVRVARRNISCHKRDLQYNGNPYRFGNCTSANRVVKKIQ